MDRIISLILSRRLFLSSIAAAYLVIGLAAFAPVMHAGFMADDWFFLNAVSKADNALVAFMVWGGRFIRPLVTLAYYLSYRQFGLSPFPLHLAVVLLHVVNAWLVAVLVLRIAPSPNRLMAFGAGLIFLLFAGHSEAVAWAAGMADAVLVPFLVAALLAFDRGLDDPKPARWMLLAWIAGACGLFAKETALILPALAAAYGVLAGPAQEGSRRRLARTAVFVAGALVIFGAYWIFRTNRFGSALGAYNAMGTSEGQRIAIARMFFLRAFVPPGRIAVFLWVHYVDLLVFAALALVVAMVWWRDRPDRGGLAFVVAALVIALGPALPLSISLATTLTERYLYVATMFSCMLMAWVIVRVVRPVPLAAVLLAGAAAVQWHYLARSNRTWVEGYDVFQGVVSGLAGIARDHAPLDRTIIVLLNMPDAIDRAGLDGSAASVALRLMKPGIDAPETHLRIVAVHDRAPGGGVVRVEQAGARFTVDVGPDTLVPAWFHDTDEYSVVEQAPHRFTVLLKPGARRRLVTSWSEGRLQIVAQIEGSGLPFGSVDLPAADATCAGPSVRFAGWALDDVDGVEVFVERDDGRGGWTRLGPAEWRSGTRPDVAAAFRGFQSTDRAEWNYYLPCAGDGALPLPARVRVVARDRDGHEADLGTRLVGAGR